MIEPNILKLALEQNDRKLLSQVPKADLHNHAPLGFDIKLLERFVKKEIEYPPSYFTLTSFENYITTNLSPFFKDREIFEYCVQQCIERSVNDGVKYLEMSVSIAHHKKYPSLYEFVEYIDRVRLENSDRIDFRPEVGLRRERGAGFFFPIIYELLESGSFYAIDLTGDEIVCPAADFKDIYAFARSKNIKRKAHAGEFADHSWAMEAILSLQLNDVQHGISLCNCLDAMKWVRENDIRLNICPASNRFFGISQRYNIAPIRILFDNGITVTVNSDDYLIFGSSVSDELLHCYNSNLFSIDEIQQIINNSFKK